MGIREPPKCACGKQANIMIGKEFVCFDCMDKPRNEVNENLIIEEAARIIQKRKDANTMPEMQPKS